jgi:hypothetical protein
VWASVTAKEAQLQEDEEAVELAKSLLQRHKDEAVGDAAPMK